jgi:beta-lactamase class D
MLRSNYEPEEKLKILDFQLTSLGYQYPRSTRSSFRWNTKHRSCLNGSSKMSFFSMIWRQFLIIVTCFLCIFPLTGARASPEENFLLIEGVTNEIVVELGPHGDERITPCSTFKIVLSLMGYDAGILKDEKIPIWPFQEGYVDYLESWKVPQTPQSWIKNSCVWYSKILAEKLGLEKIQNYLGALQYGNQDLSGGLTSAWLSSSLKISPREQVVLLQKMIRGELPISSSAIQMTRAHLFLEELPSGWKLFGKTGLGQLANEQNLEVGWFVGWVEKGENSFIFAYSIREEKILASQRIPRVKQILTEDGILP